MNTNTKLILSFGVLALFSVQLVQSGIFGPIDGGLLSTLRIVGKLCLPGNHNDTVAKAFMACYDEAPGKAQFLECQTSALGHVLDSSANICDACLHLPRMKTYADCIKDKLAAANIDAQDAITKVNICQGKVLGL